MKILARHPTAILVALSSSWLVMEHLLAWLLDSGINYDDGGLASMFFAGVFVAHWIMSPGFIVARVFHSEVGSFDEWIIATTAAMGLALSLDFSGRRLTRWLLQKIRADP